MRLYLIRHGDPDYENDCLTEKGHKEARALAKRLAAHGLDRIYVSPQRRAKETMLYTAELLGMEYQVELWTRELWPEFAIESPWGRIMTMDIPGEYFREKDEMPGCESWRQDQYLHNETIARTYDHISRQSDAFFKALGYERAGRRYRILSANTEQVAVFCHAGFGLTWLSQLLELPMSSVYSGFWLAPTSVTTILFEERSKEWAVPKCIGLGDVSHLYEAGLPVSFRGLYANYR